LQNTSANQDVLVSTLAFGTAVIFNNIERKKGLFIHVAVGLCEGWERLGS
jgi:hypothetical protein